MPFWSKRDKGSGDPAKVTYVWSTNAMLRVAAPAASGWQRMEAPARPPMLAAIKCMRGEPPDALALDAILYEPPADQLPTVAALRARDWQAHFAHSLFASIERCDVEEVAHPRPNGFSDSGCEIAVQGKLRQPDMEVLLRERHVISGARLLVVSATASPALHDEHDKLIAAWLEHASLGG